MSKRVFIDSDVILDLFCRREPFYQDAAELFTMGDSRKIQLLTTSIVFANVFFILRKILGIEKAKEMLRKLRIIVSVISADEKVVDLALNSRFSDFEDGLQYFTARENGVRFLITRNIRDYRENDLLVLTPREYLNSRLVKSTK